MPEELLLFMLLLGLAALLVFLNYYRKSKEHFKDPITSYSLYKQYGSKEYDNQMSIYKETLGDISDFLLVYGCGINIGTAPEALNELVEASARGLYVVPFSIYTPNIIDVNNKIYSMIQEFYDKIGRNKIQGQIYVVLSQSPYYRDENNTPISIQFSYTNYLSLPYNAAKNTGIDSNPPIQFYGHLIFTAYNRDANLITDTDVRMTAVLNIKKNFRQKEGICFIQCPHGDLPCGCASQDAPYLTNCLESTNPSQMSSGERYTYAILYRVNPRFSDFIARNIMETDYSDYEWSPDYINPIPTRQYPTLPDPDPLRRSGVKGIVMYQNCNYKGWRSQLIPPGRYNRHHLANYGIRGDASSYKTYGNVKVDLYKSSNYRNGVEMYADEKYNDASCFTKYMGVNDQLMSIVIRNSTQSNRARETAEAIRLRRIAEQQMRARTSMTMEELDPQGVEDEDNVDDDVPAVLGKLKKKKGKKPKKGKPRRR